MAKRGIGRFIDLSFDHPKTGTFVPRFYLLVPRPVAEDPDFPFKKGEEVFIELNDDGSITIEKP